MCALLSAMVVVSALGSFQFTSTALNVQGEVVGQGLGARELRLELVGQGGGGAPQLTWSRPGERFEFSRVEPGTYTLRVMTWRGDVLRNEPISVGSGTPPLRIVIPGGALNRPPVGSVSVARLRRDPEGKSVYELAEARRLFLIGDRKRALKRVIRALEHDPEYPEAHAAFGMYHASEKRWADAAQEFSAAVRCDPKLDRGFEMLAWSLVHSERFVDAESAARQALQAAPRSALPSHLLGLSLAAQGRFGEETVACFRRAAPEIPEAREALKRLLEFLESAKTAAK